MLRYLNSYIINKLKKAIEENSVAFLRSSYFRRVFLHTGYGLKKIFDHLDWSALTKEGA